MKGKTPESANVTISFSLATNHKSPNIIFFWGGGTAQDRNLVFFSSFVHLFAILKTDKSSPHLKFRLNHH